MRETLSKNTSSVLLLFEPALPLGIEHSLGQPGTSLFYRSQVIKEMGGGGGGEGEREGVMRSNKTTYECMWQVHGLHTRGYLG